METSRGRWAGIGSSLLLMTVTGLPGSVATAAIAQFDLRLAPTEADAVLDVNDPEDQVLDLQLLVTMLDGPVQEDILGFSVFLKPSSGGVVRFEAASFRNVLSDDPAYEQGADNQPVSGAFSRGVGFLPATMLGPDQTTLATFSVRALSPGTVAYHFLDSRPMRPWSIDFYDFSSATVVAGEPLTIRVIPEPRGLVLLAWALAWAVGGRGRGTGEAGA